MSKNTTSATRTNKPTKKVFFKKRQGCPLSRGDGINIDYKTLCY